MEKKLGTTVAFTFGLLTAASAAEGDLSLEHNLTASAEVSNLLKISQEVPISGELNTFAEVNNTHPEGDLNREQNLTAVSEARNLLTMSQEVTVSGELKMSLEVSNTQLDLTAVYELPNDLKKSQEDNDTQQGTAAINNSQAEISDAVTSPVQQQATLNDFASNYLRAPYLEAGSVGLLGAAIVYNLSTPLWTKVVMDCTIVATGYGYIYWYNTKK